jgi:hypothetical protein
MFIDPCGDHLADDLLERYAIKGEWMGDDLPQVEEHLLVCSGCRRRLEEFEEWLKDLRGAAIQSCALVTVVHETDTGPVHLHLERSEEGVWISNFRGRDLEGTDSFATRSEALEYLRRSFGEMFPGHGCGPRCRITEYAAL